MPSFGNIISQVFDIKGLGNLAKSQVQAGANGTAGSVVGGKVESLLGDMAGAVSSWTGTTIDVGIGGSTSGAGGQRVYYGIGALGVPNGGAYVGTRDRFGPVYHPPSGSSASPFFGAGPVPPQGPGGQTQLPAGVGGMVGAGGGAAASSADQKVVGDLAKVMLTLKNTADRPNDLPAAVDATLKPQLMGADGKPKSFNFENPVTLSVGDKNVTIKPGFYPAGSLISALMDQMEVAEVVRKAVNTAGLGGATQRSTSAPAPDAPAPAASPTTTTPPAPGAAAPAPNIDLANLSKSEAQNLQASLERLGLSTGAKNHAHGGNVTPDKMDGLFQRQSNASLAALAAANHMQPDQMAGLLLSGDATRIAALTKPGAAATPKVATADAPPPPSRPAAPPTSAPAAAAGGAQAPDVTQLSKEAIGLFNQIATEKGDIAKLGQQFIGVVGKLNGQFELDGKRFDVKSPKDVANLLAHAAKNAIEQRIEGDPKYVSSRDGDHVTLTPEGQKLENTDKQGVDAAYNRIATMVDAKTTAQAIQPPAAAVNASPAALSAQARKVFNDIVIASEGDREALYPKLAALTKQLNGRYLTENGTTYDIKGPGELAGLLVEENRGKFIDGLAKEGSGSYHGRAVNLTDASREKLTRYDRTLAEVESSIKTREAAGTEVAKAVSASTPSSVFVTGADSVGFGASPPPSSSYSTLPMGLGLVNDPTKLVAGGSTLPRDFAADPLAGFVPPPTPPVAAAGAPGRVGRT